MALVVTGQGIEKRHNGGDLLVGQIEVELGRAHPAHGILECWSAAVMKVWSGLRNVPQAGNAQHDRLPPADRAKHTMALKQVAADIHALVARHTAERFELPVAVEPLRAERAGITS